jgi:hypothetical protein
LLESAETESTLLFTSFLSPARAFLRHPLLLLQVPLLPSLRAGRYTAVPQQPAASEMRSPASIRMVGVTTACVLHASILHTHTLLLQRFEQLHFSFVRCRCMACSVHGWSGGPPSPGFVDHRFLFSSVSPCIILLRLIHHRYDVAIAKAVAEKEWAADWEPAVVLSLSGETWFGPTFNGKWSGFGIVLGLGLRLGLGLEFQVRTYLQW